MTIAIIDYGSGNLLSARKAFEYALIEARSSKRVVVTNDPLELKNASHIVLPGVGAFAECRRALANLVGMEDALEENVRVQKKPFLGICVGMQLLATIGREHNLTKGLNWIPGEVVNLSPENDLLKIPHMGWNNVSICESNHPILKDIKKDIHFYFVHSYVFKPDNASDIIATVEYGGPVVAIIGRENIIGTQFHPEKSQVEGLRLISNFIKL